MATAVAKSFNIGHCTYHLTLLLETLLVDAPPTYALIAGLVGFALLTEFQRHFF